MWRRRRFFGASRHRFRPKIDEAMQGVIGDELFSGKMLHGGWAGVVSGVEPALNAGTVVRDTGAQADRGFHDFQGDGAPEITGHRYLKIILHHDRERRETNNRGLLNETVGFTFKKERVRGVTSSDFNFSFFYILFH